MFNNVFKGKNNQISKRSHILPENLFGYKSENLFLGKCNALEFLQVPLILRRLQAAAPAQGSKYFFLYSVLKFSGLGYQRSRGMDVFYVRILRMKRIRSTGIIINIVSNHHLLSGHSVGSAVSFRYHTCKDL